MDSDEDQDALLTDNPHDDSTKDDQSDLQENTSVILRLLRNVSVEVPFFIWLFCWAFHENLVVNLMQDKTCVIYYNVTPHNCINDSSPMKDDVQRFVASLHMQNNVLKNVPGMVICLLLGHWSDSHGRKIPLIVPIVGKIAATCIYLLCAIYFESRPEYLLIGSLPQAMTGGYPTFIMACYSYISAVVKPEKRTQRIGFLDGASLLGPVVGGLLSMPAFSALGYIGVFSIAISLFTIAVIYSCLRLSGDPPPQINNMGNEGMNIFSRFFKGIYSSVKVSFKKRLNYGRAIILTSLFGLCCLDFAFDTIALKFLFVEKKFSWTYDQFTVFFIGDFLTSFIGVTILLPVILHFLQLGPIGLLTIGCLSGILHFLFIGIASYSWFIYLSAASSLFKYVPAVVMRSTTSQVVSKNEVGKVFSFICCIEGLMPLLSSPGFTLVYNSTIDYFPGMVFIISSALFGICLISTLPVQVLHRRQTITTQGLIEQVEGEIHEDEYSEPVPGLLG